MITHLGTLGTF